MTATAYTRVHDLAVIWMVLCWIGYGIPFLLRKRFPGATDRKRDPRSIPGIIVQSVAYVPVWAVRRPPGTPIVPLGPALDWIGPFLVFALGSISVVMVVSAVRTLGRQWSLAARLTEGHRLVTEGPYRFVRHPIYAAMGGMMLVTGIAISRAWVIPPAAALFAIGTAIRVRSEERLLREAFGEEFEAFRERVGSVLPRLR